MQYVFFWVFPRRLSFKSRRFGTLYRFHLHGQVKMLVKMEPIEGSETSDFKPKTPGKYPKESILHKEHGESLKSRNQLTVCLANALNNPREQTVFVVLVKQFTAFYEYRRLTTMFTTPHHLYTTAHHMFTTAHHMYTTARHLFTTPHHLYTTARHLFTTPRHMFTTARHLFTTARHLFTTAHHLFTTARHLLFS